mmetsp:Transcript_1899/g.3599  ORF Transcript_1899/g.3599 Transcript_1899/m.3599 type:complete len:204 (-) Transcript_1899:145-756(-)
MIFRLPLGSGCCCRCCGHTSMQEVGQRAAAAPASLNAEHAWMTSTDFFNFFWRASRSRRSLLPAEMPMKLLDFLCGSTSGGGDSTRRGSSSLVFTPYPNCSKKLLRRGAAAFDGGSFAFDGGSGFVPVARTSFASARAAASSCKVKPCRAACSCDWPRRRWRPDSPPLAVLQRLIELLRLGSRFMSERNASMSSLDRLQRFTA